MCNVRYFSLFLILVKLGWLRLRSDWKIYIKIGLLLVVKYFGVSMVECI